MDNILHLSTLDNVFLIIAAVAISLFFLIGTILLGAALVLVSKIKKVITKAEGAINSVEEATATIRNIGEQATGPLAIIKVVKNILDLVNRKK